MSTTYLFCCLLNYSVFIGKSLALPTFRLSFIFLVSFLKGGEAPPRECFYWELHEGGSKQAVRFGNWKAVKNGPTAKIELYDLATDPGESNDVSGEHAAEVTRAEELLTKERVDDPAWPLKQTKGK